MLLAAFLGALAAELIPAYGTHLPVSIFGVICVATLGTLLPVPMALDVALAYVLYHAGVPTPYGRRSPDALRGGPALHSRSSQHLLAERA
jgi:hypothetical protein